MNQIDEEATPEPLAEKEIELLYISVNKRTNLEIYLQGPYEDDSYKNVVPGTVIDSHSGVASSGGGPTDSKPVEFYLISQSQRQGMNYPCKYSILHDTVGESISKVELLSYKLCHLYFNIGGPIKVPAPVQYAYKLAHLVAEKNELGLENGPDQEPLRIHESFQQKDSTLYFI